MAHGLPDYYRGVDIAYQALSQLIVRPKYGGAKKSREVKVVTAMAETELLSISGKGMIYGGHTYLDAIASQASDYVRLYVDGEELHVLQFDTMDTYGLIVENSSPLYLLKYDDVNFIYCVAYSHGITFESSLVVTYGEHSDNTPQVTTNLAYALIT